MTVRLYSRPGCHLCEQVEEHLAALRPEHPHMLQVVDIDRDERLRRRYGLTVPVVVVDDRFVLVARITRELLSKTLRRAEDSAKAG